jgi:hypothetical protein
MFERESGASPVADKSAVTYYPVEQVLQRNADARIVVRVYGPGLVRRRPLAGLLTSSAILERHWEVPK